MRLKSTLWALAFACAAVSCSDDLENGPNVNNNNGEMGEADAYLKVVVNSDIATKAADSEEEPGSRDEYEVKDVTIILFNNGESTDYGFGADSQIKGVGFAQVGQMEGSGTDNHSFMAQIEVPVSDPGSTLAGNTYGVIAVTNLGGSKDVPNDLYKAIKDQTSGTKSQRDQNWPTISSNTNSIITRPMALSCPPMPWNGRKNQARRARLRSMKTPPTRTTRLP